MGRGQFRNYRLLLLIAVLAVVSIGTAYAALSATLTVTVNKVTQSALEWNPRITTCTVSTVGTSTTETSCGAATVASNGLSVTIADTKLSKPEDACIYKCTISNVKTGTPATLPAKINSVVPTSPSGITCSNTSASSSESAKMVCGNITYGIYATASTSGTTSNFTTGQTIASGSTKDFYLVAQYTGTTVNSTAVTHTGGKFTFTLGQA